MTRSPFAAFPLLLALTFTPLTPLATAPLAAAPAFDPILLAGLRARSIGPSVVSGRVAAVESVASNPSIVYVGAAAGGVWKSLDAGLTWEPIFDDQPVASIGAIAVHPQSPDIVWVGTGEANPRNSVSLGNGVYKSLDGGKTWAHLGLDGSERIPKIVLHPTDPRIAWVAAMGPAWGDGPVRGVFKTADGGKTWRKVLYVDEKTGAADLVAEPGNPDHLYAAMWQFRRWPWYFRSGGPGSGLFESHDGGETWKRLTEEDGLPKGNLGRIALAFAPGDPRRVYALVEAKQSAFLRSDDDGRTWKSVNNEPNVTSRPFYFSHIAVDPQDADRIYRLATEVDSSDDGGRTWSTLVPFKDVHPDFHAIWIDPGDGNHILLGNDGGVAVSRDRGKNWGYVQNLPIPQFYHVRFDDAVPYNVYGGMQDNGAWKGPSTVWVNGGIRNSDWHEVGFGDGFDTAPDPKDPSRGYSLSQGGHIVRWDLTTGERKDVQPAPAPGGKLRFNWNAGFAVDPFDPDTIYLGSQFLHHSTDRGETWTAISPDLTTNRAEWQRQDVSGGLIIDATAAENFTTILAIAPSPVERGVIWVGTDDGRLQVTRDGGKTWQSVEGNVTGGGGRGGVPANSWIPQITPSRFDAGTAYVVFDNHRRSDTAPYVVKTTDYGRTWQSLVTRDLRGYALATAEDPGDRNLLFLGTEYGLWFSPDGGKGWLPLKGGLPTTSYMALTVQPREGDLIAATHGRGIYIVDDIRPLRTLSGAVLKEPLHLFDIADAVEHRVGQPAGSHFPGTGEYRGDTRPYGALLTYTLNAPGLPLPDPQAERTRKTAELEQDREKALAAERQAQGTGEEEPKPPASGQKVEAAAKPEGGGRGGAGGGGGGGKDGKDGKEGPKARIEILDASGKVIRSFEQPATLGVNRAVWDLGRKSYKTPNRRNRGGFFRDSGPEVAPGTYRVRVTFGDHHAEGPVNVLPDPRFNIPQTARDAREKAFQEAGAVQETLATGVERIGRIRSDVQAVTAEVKKNDEERKRREDTTKPDPAAKDLLEASQKLLDKLKILEQRFWHAPTEEGELPDTDAQSKVGRALQSLQSSWDAPTPAQQAYLEIARQTTKDAVDALNRFAAEDVAAFRKKVAESELRLLPELPPLPEP
jgi:photosystem II stability/assembly factor-like uncharacterized protein